MGHTTGLNGPHGLLALAATNAILDELIRPRGHLFEAHRDRALRSRTAFARACAAGAIKIDRIYFDSPGSDGGSNSSLNAEWIRLKNTGANGRSLTNWTIRDKAGHVYRFGTYRLGAGKTVTVHTGSGSNSARHRYWHQDWYVWNTTATVRG
jgi:Lamin Tail Domain